MKFNLFYKLILFFLIASLLIFLYWLLYARFYESTNDAYVSGNQIIVTPQLPGIITQVRVDNSFFVDEGHPLVVLDATAQTIELNRAKEKLAATCRDVVHLFEKVKECRANLIAKQAVLVNSVHEFQKRKMVLSSGAVSLEDFQEAESQMKQNKALCQLARAQLESARAQIEGTTVQTHPKILEAQEALKNAYLKRQRCEITAPASGLIAQKNAQVGQWVSAPSHLMTIIPLSQMWIDANFREVQLKYIHLGQNVKVHSDLYGSHVEYRGKVVGIGAGTGSVFSILPPQNAVGNWIKIVQRVPVRIELDPRDLAAHPLRLGLSMKVKVDIRDQSGEIIPQPSLNSQLYQTDVFQHQMDGVDSLIESILKANIAKAYIEGKESPCGE